MRPISLFGQRPLTHPIFERFPLDVTHDQIGIAVMLGKIVDGDDVGMFQSGDDFGFARKAAQKRFIIFEGGVQHFDGHMAIQSGMVSFVDRGHAPFA